jgi:RND family efflux transporter MFP subunit
VKSASLKRIVAVVLIGGTAGLGWAIFDRLQEQGVSRKRVGSPQAAPVEVAPIERGPIQLRRTFSGALESPAEFVVGPKISGRIVRLGVALADTVQRGQVVAWLDDDEPVQLVAQAEAELAVARASLAEAKSALVIATRALQRIETLRARGVASESQFDTAKADHLTKEARCKVAEAQVTKAEAALQSAKIRLGYTKVTAGWSGGNDQRVVAERFVDEGETVAANAPLLSIVELNPMRGVIFVAERDYARLRPGLPASLSTDAYPGKQFQGRIDRIAPIFRQTTRQARVELVIENLEHQLKPGMFIRATVVLERVAGATIVPELALTTRDDRTGVFVVNDDGRSVAWREVRVGIREGNRVQVEGEGLTGRVVTLGQQLVKDGSATTISPAPNQTASTAAKDDAK